MTEKRFNVTANEENWLEITDNGVNLSQLQVCDLLNNLSEENEQLKDALNQRTDQCDKLYEENKTLRQKLKYMAEQYGYSEKLKKMLNFE